MRFRVKYLYFLFGVVGTVDGGLVVFCILKSKFGLGYSGCFWIFVLGIVFMSGVFFQEWIEVWRYKVLGDLVQVLVICSCDRKWILIRIQRFGSCKFMQVIRLEGVVLVSLLGKIFWMYIVFFVEVFFYLKNINSISFSILKVQIQEKFCM